MRMQLVHTGKMLQSTPAAVLPILGSGLYLVVLLYIDPSMTSSGRADVA